MGPKPRSYRQRTPKKMVQLALRGALTDRARSGNVVVVESWDFTQPSTRQARQALTALGLERRVLVVLDRTDDVAARSFRNLPQVDLLDPSQLNAYDVLCSDWVVFTRSTLPGLVTEKAPEAVAGTGPAEEAGA